MTGLGRVKDQPNHPVNSRAMQLRIAMDALNPYKRAELRAAFESGFRDSPTNHYYVKYNSRAGRIAYGKGWNARRDASNMERFPAITPEDS